MPKTIAIGKFGKTFGIRGWIKIHSFVDEQEQILSIVPWLIENKGDFKELTLEDSKIQHRSIVVKIKGVDTPEAAKFYTNTKIFTYRASLPKLKKGQYYWDDLIGLTVVNKEDITLGTVDHLFNTGANDVLVVKNGKEYLIPYIKNTILNIDIKNKTIKVDWDKDF